MIRRVFILFLLNPAVIGTLISPAMFAAEDISTHKNAQREAEISKKKESLQIKARARLAAMESSTEPVPKVEERTFSVPEIPQPLREEGLSPAKSARLLRLEEKLARGEITETEFELERDRLYRSSNAKF